MADSFGPISTPILYDSITPALSRFLFVIEFENVWESVLALRISKVLQFHWPFTLASCQLQIL